MSFPCSSSLSKRNGRKVLSNMLGLLMTTKARECSSPEDSLNFGETTWLYHPARNGWTSKPRGERKEERRAPIASEGGGGGGGGGGGDGEGAILT